jgi:DNA-binding response OmpR family regulator
MNSAYQNPNPTVLIIDDDPSATSLFKKILTPKEYQVLITHSSREGLESIERVMLDLIILDLLMPEIDGWQLLRKIRKLTRTPILIISALDSSEIITKTLDMGADDYLVKPVTSTTLLAHVHSLVRRHQTEELALPENN